MHKNGDGYNQYNSYCKPHQGADRWKMSENSKFSEKYLRKNGPGAASAQGKEVKLLTQYAQ